MNITPEKIETRIAKCTRHKRGDKQELAYLAAGWETYPNDKLKQCQGRMVDKPNASGGRTLSPELCKQLAVWRERTNCGRTTNTGYYCEQHIGR